MRRLLSEEQRRELDQWLHAVSAYSVPAEGEGVSSRSGLDEAMVSNGDITVSFPFRVGGTYIDLYNNVLLLYEPAGQSEQYSWL